MTAQVHENLIYEGEKTTIAFCPPLPKDHPRVVELSTEALEKMPHGGAIFTTACWRQYVGTWEVKDGRFYLVNLAGCIKLIGDEPLFADWFSGILRIPRGKMLQYVHMGFGSVFEEELHVKIEDGVVVKTRTVDNRNAHQDEELLGWQNLPGLENRFPGDDAL